MGLRADWPNLGVISLAHSYGFSNLILPLLLHGIPLILAPAPLPEIIRRAAERKNLPSRLPPCRRCGARGTKPMQFRQMSDSRFRQAHRCR